jgi:hypothetical protein
MKNNIKINIKELLNLNLQIRKIEGIWEFENLLNEFNINFYDLNSELFDKSLFEYKVIYQY